MSYPPLAELEMQLNVGRGTVIIVEGDAYHHDPYFYRYWFDDLARSVTFAPQNGWLQVRRAVQELRSRRILWPVYGLIDRDFSAETELESDFATFGIIRTQRYTLENYLLEPEHWAATLRNVYQRYPELATQWADVAHVRQKIEQGYRTCIPLAAHNFVIRYVTATYPHSIASPLKYLEHYKAINSLDFVGRLHTVRQQVGCSEDLNELYSQKVQELQSASLESWHEQICGKYVLDWFHAQLPNRPGRGQIALDDYLDRYMDTGPAPPADLHQIVMRILQHANLS